MTKADLVDIVAGKTGLTKRDVAQGVEALLEGSVRVQVIGESGREALLYRVILAASNPGDIVLDPFMGSGSTGKAAVPDGFHFIGIERDPSYFAVTERRINNAQPELVQQELGEERGLEEDHV